MGSLSFKSAGKTREQKIIESISTSQIPIGVKTPMRSDATTGLIAMNYSLEDQIQDNFKHLLLTNWGERLIQHDYGADLQPLVVNWHSDDDFQSNAVERINVAVKKWMPYIDLNEFSSENVGGEASGFPNNIIITVSYDIPALNVKNKSIQIILTPN